LSDSERVAELQELWTRLAALEEAYSGQKVCFYEPIGQQPAFHTADDATVRLVLGSNRSGKSVAGVVEAIAHALGYRPWLAEDDPDRIVRLANGRPIPVPNVGRIIAQNYQQAINQTIWPKLQEWAPRGWYKIKKDQRGIPVQMTWANDSVIYLMSNDQDDMAFEGTNGHWVWADEPIDYSKYVGLKRGLVDFSGHMWMTMTPLTQPWIHDVIVQRANEQDGSVRLFKFSIWDNCVDNGGHLRREDIEEFLSDLREEELEARLHGNFLHLAGRVFKAWNPEPPYWIPHHNVPDTWPRVCVIDPHPRKPVAVLWMAITPDDQVVCYRDLFDPKLVTISQVADKIKEMEGWTQTHDGDWVRGVEAEPVAMRIIDNSANEQERTSGDTVWKRFAMEQLWCQLAKKRNAQAGYDAIHEALRIGKYEWEEPQLVVFDSCRHVKNNFQNFCWDDWNTSKQRDLKGDKQEVRKNKDDFIDCIRYYFQAGLNYQILRREARRARDENEDYNGIKLSRKREEWQRSSTFQPQRGSSFSKTALRSTRTFSTPLNRRIPNMREID
jgi:hypothetical protein